ncbi:hypothetical protein [Parasedimentitalea psychrophila]|uniref:Uncharacterized protein n=1 Tax=Parasedimentitalea psychrophila TaxID=2997337 RepID=A0A9Y2P5K9_9RHOB|nr:hypothetical protein [Parasedimentitalea psychrophila]WIY23700.1 hypothetical protein QPJ95_13700 [Parasedimentitalea psychrophila]
MSKLRPLEELLFHMRTMARSSNEWEAKFARSILRQAKQSAWSPSDKQQQIMRRMVSEMFTHSGADTSYDIGLIDRGDRHDAA